MWYPVSPSSGSKHVGSSATISKVPEENRKDTDISATTSPSPSSSSSSLVATRKKRKVSFAPNPLKSLDNSSVQLPPPKEQPSSSRRSTRILSRLNDTSESTSANVVEISRASTELVGVTQPSLSTSDSANKAPSMTESPETRKTRSQSSAVALPQIVLPQDVVPSDEESVCSSVSSATSSSCSPLRGDGRNSKRRGRPRGSKNRSTLAREALEANMDKNVEALEASMDKNVAMKSRSSGGKERIAEGEHDAESVMSVADSELGSVEGEGVAGVKNEIWSEGLTVKKETTTVKQGTAQGWWHGLPFWNSCTLTLSFVHFFTYQCTLKFICILRRS